MKERGGGDMKQLCREWSNEWLRLNSAGFQCSTKVHVRLVVIHFISIYEHDYVFTRMSYSLISVQIKAFDILKVWKSAPRASGQAFLLHSG